MSTCHVCVLKYLETVLTSLHSVSLMCQRALPAGYLRLMTRERGEGERKLPIGSPLTLTLGNILCYHLLLWPPSV